MNSPLVSHLRTLSILACLGLALLGPQLRAEPAPDWKLQDLDGKTVKLSDYKGKVVILDFWATWCPPCRAEIPHFIELQKQYGAQGLVIIGMSLDEGGAKVVSDFAKAKEINYPVVIGTQDIATAYGGIEAIPTTFIIDAKGNIVNKYIGLTDKDVFEGEIKKLLPATPPATK
jgi:cytochrome c biogenesis protein CcmG/thiol:disulfide interchange protein DsbE